MAEASADGRPFVWKNRDGGEPTGSRRHFLGYVTGRSYRYLGVHPSDADPRMGVNEKGLAFGNCTAQAFKRSQQYDYANTQALKQYILGETSSVEEARRAILANTLGSADDWPTSVALMPGIFDATGKVVLWEIGDEEVYEYDPEAPARRAQLRWPIYARDNTVHARTDHTDDLGYTGTRYTIPRDLLLAAAERGGVTVEDFIRAARAGEPGVDGNRVPSRDRTTATMIAHGVLSGEDPRIVTMWNALGQPDYAVFVPVWVAVGDSLSPRASSNDLGESLSGASERLWLKNDGDGYDVYVNGLLEPMEANFLEAVRMARERWLRSGFEPDEARRIHREASETAWHTLSSLAAGSGRSLNATPRLTELTADTSGLRVAFAARAVDPDGPIASHHWSFGDGATSAQPRPVHTYASPGTYLVRVRVSDAGGSRNSRWRYVDVAGE